MPSNTFTLADRPYLARAIAAGATHGDLTIFESGLGIKTVGRPKDQRAVALLSHIFEDVSNSDAVLMDLLDAVFVDSPAAEFRVEEPEYVKLRDEVLVPRGVRLDGRHRVLMASKGEARMKSSKLGGFEAAAAPQAGKLQPWPADGGQATTARPTLTTAPTGEGKQQVFIVHGRDMQPVTALETYLHFLGLRWLGWNEASRLTGDSTPHTYDIIAAGMKAASAIIVVFSPDEEARLHEDFRSNRDSAEFGRQPRQNVLLEAGMAFAMARGRTVFVRSSNAGMRDISDITGFNWVTLDGSWESRELMNIRLENAGVHVQPQHQNLAHHLAGPFRA